MAERFAVVALGQPDRHWDARGQVGRGGCRGRRGSLRAGDRKLSHGSGGVGSEPAEVDDDDAVSLRRGVAGRSIAGFRAGLWRPLRRAR